MKEGRPSLTAFYVAYARALATRDPALSRACQDEVAAELLPRPLRELLRYAGVHPRVSRLLCRSALGMSEHLALRTRVIDDAVNEAVQRGVRQLVVLGAGFDARAHRMPQLADVAVFEVDHPSTQPFKRKKAKGLPLCARTLRYVACDFERESFGEALERSAFDARAPSVWIWEGVTMYLPLPVVEAALAIIAAESAPHSRLITSYLRPPPAHLRALEALGVKALALLAEPVHSHFTPKDMARLLRARGFYPVSDISPRALAERYAVSIPVVAPGMPGERIVVADKRTAGAPG